MRNKTDIFPIILLLSISLLFISCAQKQEKVKRIQEDGIEVVLNQKEPYKIKNITSNLILEHEMSIDTERDEIVETGLVDIETFDVDDEGNIFLIRWASNEDFVYKFDSQGNFVKSFVRRGQGPGEIEWGGSVRYIGDNKLKIKDPSEIRYSIYNTEGEFLRDVRLNSHINIIKIFDNEKQLVYWQDMSPSGDKHIDHLGLCDSKFENMKEIYVCSFPNSRVAEKVYIPRYSWVEGTSEEKIFIGDGEKGYEILVFDLEGNMIRKIKKEYDPVELSEEYINNFNERKRKIPSLEKYVLRKHFPPFQYFFTDEERRLYVMTYENGTSPNEWMFDIFTPDGVFSARVPIKNRLESQEVTILSKHNRIYSVCEKGNGYKELVVYKMRWE